MVEVYSRSLEERFLQSRCSLAYLFRVCWYIALCIPPVYIAYSTGSFWKKQETYLEQPVCQFTKSLVLIANAADGTPVIQYSTIERYNYLLGYENVKQPTQVKSWQRDTNYDAKPDEWSINLVFPMSTSDQPIVSLSALLFFHITYTQDISLDMDSMIHITSGTGMRGNKVLVVGDMEFYQRNPLSRTSAHGTRNVYAYSLLNDSSIQVADDISLETLLLRNTERNETFNINSNSQHSYWSTSPYNNFNVTFHFNVPTSTITYIPSPGETIKFAYIQWLAIFWLMYFGLKFVREFVFAQNIVETMRIRDGVPTGKLHQF